jgi:hypothetical protein
MPLPTAVLAAGLVFVMTAGLAGQPRAAQASRPADASRAVPREEPAPTEEALGMPVYPGAQFLRSFDAGRGQRYFLYGTQASFAEIVAYYRTILRQRGSLVFDRPATHMFEVGRYRQATMAFPPSITVKDFGGTGSGGYPNPRPGGEPARFPTVIQLVPAPPGEP